MKKILSTFNVQLSIVLAFALTLASCGGTDRAHQLKVLNWADYIDEDVKENFEQWYFEQTGEKVQLVYETFDVLVNVVRPVQYFKLMCTIHTVTSGEYEGYESQNKSRNFLHNFTLFVVYYYGY